jgi:hypothetical protein
LGLQLTIPIIGLWLHKRREAKRIDAWTSGGDGSKDMAVIIHANRRTFGKTTQQALPTRLQLCCFQGRIKETRPKSRSAGTHARCEGSADHAMQRPGVSHRDEK